MERNAALESHENLHQVRIIPLKKIVNERGGLMEVQRKDDSHFQDFGQLYITHTLPGVTKAWYRHHHQLDQIALIRGEILLVLYDTRPGSPSVGIVQKIHITEERPKLVQIPVLVWHGFQALGCEPAYLAHLNSVPISFENTDEDRLPPHDPTIPHRWLDAETAAKVSR